MDIIDSFCNEIGISPDEFENYVLSAQKRVKKARIKKKDGSKREITIPSWELKIIQYWTIINYLRKLPASDAATAYYKGSSILNNAKRHSNGKYFVKLDIESFFPSISKEIFISALKKDEEKTSSPTTKQLIEASKNSIFFDGLFYKNVCVIGYPASPYIANYVLRDFDQKISEALSSVSDQIGNYCFTRYADDIMISCEKKGNKALIYKIVEETLTKTYKGSLRIKKEKTKATTKSGGSTKITGIIICSDGRLTLHKKYKDHVRLLFSLYSKDKLKPEETSSLLGHLNYIKSVEPTLYNKLYTKYYKQIKALLNN